MAGVWLSMSELEQSQHCPTTSKHSPSKLGQTDEYEVWALSNESWFLECSGCPEVNRVTKRKKEAGQKQTEIFSSKVKLYLPSEEYVGNISPLLPPKAVQVFMAMFSQGGEGGL